MYQVRQNVPTLHNSYDFFECRKSNMSRVTLVLLLLFCEILYTRIEIVAANGNTPIKSGPVLHLEKVIEKRLIIYEPLLPHYLSCSATIDQDIYYQNNTKFYYTWFRNDYELENSWGRRSGFTIYVNGTLRLPTNEKASGIYRCKINANTTAVLSETITVSYPVLKRLQAAIYIIANSNSWLTLNCPVISVPPANVSWYFNDQIISEVRKYNSYVVLTNGSLVLRRVSLNDGGKYKCQAQNQFAIKKTRQFSFTVKVDDDVSSEASTRLIPNLQNSVQYIPKGSNLTLLCYSLNDSANIEWLFQRYKSDAPVKLGNYSTEAINIYNAEIANDQGIYTCKTKSDNQSFHVTVTVPPNISNPLLSYEILISASLTFNCKSVGNPPPKITWYHNGVHLNSSYSRYIIGNDLIFHSFDPDEDGIYQCFAHNIAGETYSAAEVRYRKKDAEVPRKNPLKNIRCFPHSFNTINITFESDTTESLFIVHIVQDNPHQWTSPFAPMKLNHTSNVVISRQLPIYRPFELITRVLFPISEIHTNHKPQQQTIQSSLRSVPVTCCTQGMLLHEVSRGINSTYLTWSQPELIGKKYFILQFLMNYTQPHPKQLIENVLLGTTQHVALNLKDIEKKIEHIVPLSQKTSEEILSRVERRETDEEELPHMKSDEDIFSVALPANVSGIVLQNFKRIKMRVLIITTENENLPQDFRYVQWNTILNGTTKLVSTHFGLSTIESRMLVINVTGISNKSCIEICLWKIQFPYFNKEQPKCEQKTILQPSVPISGLKPMEMYRLNVFSCESHEFYGQLDVTTLADPPGTINKHKILRDGGLKLTWKPPEQPNGKIHHYNILWTLGNTTHEANVLDCTLCSYKFPNLSETSKVNVSIRVVGETGIGAPIYIDLREIDNQTLERERTSENNVYSGILIGLLLSVLCIICFVTFFVLQKWYLKSSTQLTLQSEINFSNLSNVGLPRTPIQHENTLQQECFEMQTLIPRPNKAESLTNSSNSSQKPQWLMTADNNPKQCETHNQRLHDYSENQFNELNSVSENQLKSNSSRDMIQTHNKMDTVLPSGTLSFVYTAFNHPNDNKTIRLVKSGVLNTTDHGNKKSLSNRSNQNKSNDIICLLTEEEPTTRTANILESNTPGLNTISTNVLPNENENNRLPRYDQMNGISKTKKTQCNNNNISPLLKTSNKGGNNRKRRKPSSGKISKEKLEPMKESSLFSILSPEAATAPTAAESSIWANTLCVQARRPSLGPNG